MIALPQPRAWALACLIAALLLALAPWLLDLSSYTRNLMTLSFLMVAGALAWNWMGGFMGQVSFGHAALFGVGGFVAANVVLRAHLPWPVAWLASAVAAGVFALGAHPVLRLRGPYFSIATIGAGEACRLLFTYWEAFSGGASGLSLPIDTALKHELYWWGLALAALALAGSSLLRRSNVGLELLAIKSDVEAAADVGVDATFYQDVVFAISGAVVGLSGGLYAAYFGFVEPNDLFGFDRSIAFVLMTVIGGVGTIFGPVLGGAVFVLLRQFLLAHYPDFYLGLYGLLLIVIVLFEPLGLSGLSARAWRWSRS